MNRFSKHICELLRRSE